MAGIQHLIDTEAHKALFEELRNGVGGEVQRVENELVLSSFLTKKPQKSLLR